MIQALILCGGKGERLRPLTNNIPKPLVKIQGKSILGYIIDHLNSYNINDIIITTGYKSDEINQYMKKNYKKKNYKIVDSGNVDIIFRIIDSIPYIQNDLLVLYGDTLADINIYKLQKYHFKKPEKATITLWPMQSQFGIFEVDSKGVVLTYSEKPIMDYWINIGYFYFDKAILTIIKNFKSYQTFLEHLVSTNELNAYKHKGAHITVNTLHELNEAEKNINLLFNHNI